MKTRTTNTLLITAAGFLLTTLSSCLYVVDNTPGPPGHPGDAYFGVDYEHAPPYSYWDNNRDIPFDPLLGAYYYTYPGVYEFEYFVNPDEYWYGTYEIWVNAGGHGGPHGEHGYDGLDSYLMLICDPYGAHEHRDDFKTNPDVSDEQVVIEKREGEQQYRIVMQMTTVSKRPAHTPKYSKK